MLVGLVLDTQKYVQYTTERMSAGARRPEHSVCVVAESEVRMKQLLRIICSESS